MQQCPRCNGTGKIHLDKTDADGMDWEPCGQCYGTGLLTEKVIERQEFFCEGHGTDGKHNWPYAQLVIPYTTNGSLHLSGHPITAKLQKNKRYRITVEEIES